MLGARPSKTQLEEDTHTPDDGRRKREIEDTTPTLRLNADENHTDDHEGTELPPLPERGEFTFDVATPEESETGPKPLVQSECRRKDPDERREIRPTHSGRILDHPDQRRLHRANHVSWSSR